MRGERCSVQRDPDLEAFTLAGEKNRPTFGLVILPMVARFQRFGLVD